MYKHRQRFFGIAIVLGLLYLQIHVQLVRETKKKVQSLIIILAGLLTSCGTGSYSWGWFAVSPSTAVGQRNLLFLIKGLIPTLTVSLFSIALVIGLGELTRKSNELTVIEYRPLEIYTILIIEYLVLILIVSYFSKKIEIKLDMGREE